MIGTDTSPNRPNREILDFEMSKIGENIAFFLENQKILGSFLCKYCVSDIVLGFGVLRNR